MYPQLAQRVFHTPLLAAPSKAAGFVMGLGPRILGTGGVELSGIDVDAISEPTRSPQASILDDRVGQEIRSGNARPFNVVEGIAVIPITGTLIHRGAWVGSWSGEMTYEGISAQLKAAVEHNGVRAIALEFDSHGGEVAGCFALASEIRKAREEKPVYAFVCDNAHSAAYALAAQATRVIVPKTGSAGSIGVICLHADRSQQLEDAGIKVTIIAAGDHKADANPYEPLPDDVREDLAKEMEGLRTIFAEEVEQGRGEAMSATAALATEAKCILGQNAVDTGLADEVANPKEAFEAFAAEFSWRRSPLGKQAQKEGSSTMSTKDADKNKPAATSEQVTGDDGATETNDTTTDNGAGVTGEGSDAGGASDAGASASVEGAPSANAASDERNRIMGILNCDEAKGRSALANSLAGDPNMTLEQAKKHLAAAPKEKAGQTLDSQMQAEGDSDLDAAPPPSGRSGLAAKAKARFNN
ncbi:S49 family peptidase [Tritonibacter mobilis]|uniref:S49 family peptidase n=1 Tax=Tritonibacter mobilis TaxID=379347 RepID=UPI000B21CB9E|nr:S49 family peptidase [Tritonibacter mobilis]